jgi:hypothetical protein
MICLFWALLYLPNLRTAPNWYGDEILTLDIGKSLAHGELANRALYCTFYAPDYPYQPEYAFITGMCSWITNGDILGGRIFSILIGLATAMTGFYFLSRKIGYLWGLLFGITLLGYSQAVIHYRWIYPHAAVGLGVLGACFLMMRPAKARGDWRAGAFLAIGAGSHLLAIHATALALLCRLKRPHSWIPIGLPPFLVICGSLILVWLNFHDWLWEDLRALKDFYARYSAENGGGTRKFFNFLNFFIQDAFHITALIGCLLCLRRRTYMIAFMSLGLTFLLTQNRQNLPLFYYQAMIVFPLLVAAIVLTAKLVTSVIAGRFFWGSGARRTIPLICIIIAVLSGSRMIPQVLIGKIQTRVTPWVISSPADYDHVAEWINKHTDANDLVIAHWNLAWKLKCKSADILQATAWSGQSPGEYYTTIPKRERFRWDADIKKAKYVAITDLDRNWALGQGSCKDTLLLSGVNIWPVAFSFGTTIVRQNPNQNY